MTTAIQLRQYQANGCIRPVFKGWAAGHRCMLLVAPTGAGKTIMFSYISWEIFKQGKRVLLLAHRDELVNQIERALKSFGLNPAIIASKRRREFDGTNRVQVAMYLSVMSVVQKLWGNQPPHYIIVDESHHANAVSWKQLLSLWPEARILGVTATPVRGDGRGLGREDGGIFDEMVLGPSFMELLRLGHLARPIHLRPENHIDFSSVPIEHGEFQTKAQSKLMRSKLITGDAIKIYRERIDGYRMIVFCVDVEHGIEVTQMFVDGGIAAEFICGDKKIVNDEQRDAVVGRFQLAKTLVLVNVAICEEGFDLEEQKYPHVVPLMAVCLLAKTFSLGRYLQRCGRGSRVVKGLNPGDPPIKDTFFIFDQVDNFEIHGGCWWDQDWSLHGEEKEAKKKRKERAAAAMECERCYAKYDPAPACPECGHMSAHKEKAKPKMIDGNLIEVTPEMDEIARAGKKSKEERVAIREAKNRELAAKADDKARKLQVLVPRFSGKVGTALTAEIKAVADEARENGARFGLSDLHVIAEAVGIPKERKNGFVKLAAKPLGIFVPY